MSDEDTMRGVVASVLRSNACMNIEFQIAGSSIMPYGYGYVADMLEQGAISIGFADLGAFTAQYNASRFTFGLNALAGATSPDGRATIVHEATHAVLDGTCPGKTIARADNEFAAYLAETIYRINGGDPVPRGGPINEPLYQVAAKVVACAADGLYILAPYDYESLEPAIMTAYQALAQGKSVPDSDLMQGFKLPWDASGDSLGGS